MKTIMIDLGKCIGRISEVEVDNITKTPNLLICEPETEESPAKSIEIWDIDALHNLRDALSEALDEYDSEQEKI